MLPSTRESEPDRISSAWTTYFSRVMPPLFTVVAGSVTVAAWLDLLGDGAAPAAVKWGVLAAATAGSVFFHWWGGRFRHVWRRGDMLLIGDPRRGIRVSLGDVVAVRETRLQSVKWVTLRLAHRIPLGDTIRFVPRGHEAWLAPWMSSPVAAALERRVEALKAGAESPKALP